MHCRCIQCSSKPLSILLTKLLAIIIDIKQGLQYFLQERFSNRYSRLSNGNTSKLCPSPSRHLPVLMWRETYTQSLLIIINISVLYHVQVHKWHVVTKSFYINFTYMIENSDTAFKVKQDQFDAVKCRHNSWPSTWLRGIPRKPYNIWTGLLTTLAATLHAWSWESSYKMYWKIQKTATRPGMGFTRISGKDVNPPYLRILTSSSFLTSSNTFKSKWKLLYPVHLGMRITRKRSKCSWMWCNHPC